jgi:hypothetical protein
MGEEKVRVSGEISRPADAPILPTVNPASEKPVEKASGLHASVYVMLVTRDVQTFYENGLICSAVFGFP